MERIVYLIGAGFSAPLGLPIMSNFLEMSKDMYFDKPERFEYFKTVLNSINRLSTIKNYYQSDLFNIEEILSILEMSSQLVGQKLKKNFIQYLSDVVDYYTPTPIRYETNLLPSNWEDVIFSADRLQNDFGFFYASTLNLKIFRVKHIFKAERIIEPAAHYALITLNYDRVLEKFAEHLLASYSGFGQAQVNFVSEFNHETLPYSERTILAKLHGSIELKNIIPPTWSKGIDRKILMAWQMAYKALINATQIRVIGYSLPDADAYVKYLLKAAAMKAPHLKRFDVICMDDSKNSVRKRFDTFINFSKFRFQDQCITKYMDLNKSLCKESKGNQIIEFNMLEHAHSDFFV